MLTGRILLTTLIVLTVRAVARADVCMEEMPPIMPIGPQYPAIAYDTLRERLMVFAQARENDSRPNEGLWALADGEWQCLDCPAASIPRFTTPAQAVYDEARDCFMLMRTPTAAYEYDGESWTLRNFAGVSFAFPTSSWSVTYNSDAGRTIIAGTGPGGIIRLFSYDGVQGVQLPDPPTPAGYGSIAYDTIRHVLVLVARSGNNVQTWEFDGSMWSLGTGGGPLISTFLQMAFDEAHGQTLTVVGQNTYEWDGTAWATTPVAPMRNWSGRAVFDTAQQRVVAWTWLFASFSPIQWRVSAWEGEGWRYVAGSELSLGVPAYASIPGTDRGYIFGGESDEHEGVFSEFTGTRLRSIAGPTPPLEYGMAMAWDSTRERLVLFGGVGFAQGIYTHYRETWEWSAQTGWELRSTGGPLANVESSMVYDPSREVVVKYGGWNSQNGLNVEETWEWNGAVWTNRHAVGPGARRLSTFVYCPDLGASLLLRGALSGPVGSNRSDVLQWDGTSWIRFSSDLEFANEGPGAYEYAYYDTRRRRVVVPQPSTDLGVVLYWDILAREWSFVVGSNDDFQFGWNRRAAYMPNLDGFAIIGYSYFVDPGGWPYGLPISRVRTDSPYISDDPISSVVSLGDTIALSASLTSTDPSDTYLWYRDHTPLADDARYSGTASPTLTILDSQPVDAGEYRLRAVTPCGAVVSAAATIEVLPPCDGDVSGDRVVDLLDLATLLTHFGTPSGATRGDGDLDRDGDVDLIDLAVVLSRFGTVCD